MSDLTILIIILGISATVYAIIGVRLIFHEPTDNDSQLPDPSALKQIGERLRRLCKLEEAAQYFSAALKAYKGGSEHSAYDFSSTYYVLALTDQDRCRLGAAWKLYVKALEISIESRDLSRQGRIYHQLGVLSQTLKHFREAERLYVLAVDIFTTLQDATGAAPSLHQLGVLAQRRCDCGAEARYYALA
jgi:tetratricopeptide (TPR) repeat protein